MKQTTTSAAGTFGHDCTEWTFFPCDPASDTAACREVGAVSIYSGASTMHARVTADEALTLGVLFLALADQIDKATAAAAAPAPVPLVPVGEVTEVAP